MTASSAVSSSTSKASAEGAFLGKAPHTMLIAIASLAICLLEEDHARGQRYRHPWRAENPIAELIASLRAEHAYARRLLAAAEGQITMSEAELNEAYQKLTSIRTDLEQARSDARDAEQELASLEKEIVETQGANSELARAQAALKNARAEADRLMRKLTGVNDSAKLTKDQRALLDANGVYLTAKKELGQAARNVDRVKQKLFQADDRWKAARDDLKEAREATKKGRELSTTAGLGSLSDKQNLTTAKKVAAMARAVIALTEFRLRQLGASPYPRSKSQSANP
jgi:chromosome segregation ATPase